MTAHTTTMPSAPTTEMQPSRLKAELESDAHAARGAVLRPSGQFSESDSGIALDRPTESPQAIPEALLRAAFGSDPRNLKTMRQLIHLLTAEGRVEEAVEVARIGVRHSPLSPRAHDMLGYCLSLTSGKAEAVWHFKRSLVLSDEKDTGTVLRLARGLRDTGDLSGARTLFQALAEALPDDPGMLIEWAKTEECGRDLEAATALLNRADAMPQSRPAERASVGTRAAIAARTGRLEEALAILMPLGSTTPCGLNARLERGKVLDRMGRYQDSFATIEAAKRDMQAASGTTYDAVGAHACADALRGFFTAGNMALLLRAGVRRDIAQPIFVTGFTRSGTTLMEQSLTSHPSIAAGRETLHMIDLIARAPAILGNPLAFPDALSELWMAQGQADVNLLRDFYLGRTANDGTAAKGMPWFTDKQNLNTWHVGMLTLLFPASPKIRVIRHPLDSVLASFALRGGEWCFNATSLREMAEFYAVFTNATEDMLEAFPTRCLTVRYEDVVDRQETTMRRVMEHVGLPFDPQALSFTDNHHYSANESYAQVSEPLYTRSKYRYRNYMDQLAPAVPILRPVIERLGYTV